MAFSKNQSSLKELVFEIVERIPEGKVATYGQIAKLIRARDHSRSVPGKSYAHSGSVARAVGNILHQNRDLQVPCHRVIDRNGRLAPNFAFNGWKEQRRRLEAEGVSFVDEKHVDLDSCLWQEQF